MVREPTVCARNWNYLLAYDFSNNFYRFATVSIIMSDLEQVTFRKIGYCIKIKSKGNQRYLVKN